MEIEIPVVNQERGHQRCSQHKVSAVAIPLLCCHLCPFPLRKPWKAPRILLRALKNLDNFCGAGVKHTAHWDLDDSICTCACWTPPCPRAKSSSDPALHSPGSVLHPFAQRQVTVTWANAEFTSTAPSMCFSKAFTFLLAKFFLNRPVVQFTSLQTRS